MILCLDVGNSQLFGGAFYQGGLQLTFRHNSHYPFSSDQFGVFLRTVLKENGITHQVSQIAICSVVPHLDYSLRAACIKYFHIEPYFVQADTQTGLKINYTPPQEVGADRIANAVAGVHLFPGKNLAIVDFGTATTLCVIKADKTYLGGTIMPGMRLAMSALQQHTAKLSSVEIVKPQQVIGQSTTAGIQSGLFYSQYATIKELKMQIQNNYFPNEPLVTLGTGGFCHLFQDNQLFSHIEPNLVLKGLHQLILENQ